MTATAPMRLCLVGLPATGKTTYIAALWAYLTSGLPNGAYRVTEFPDNPRYLNDITAAWAAGQPMPRNSLGASDRIEFTVETPGGASVTLVLPDLPGELFRNALLRPTIDEDTADAVVHSDLLLVFVNSETAKTYTALGDYETPKQGDIEVGGSRKESAKKVDGDPALPSAAEFAIGDLDTDTLNTELIHRLEFVTRESGLPPVLVVVSAWDAQVGSASTPREWLAREQPMLSQFLDELARRVRVGVIGASAQGANYHDDPQITIKLANERSWACDEAGNRTDIAGPLVWHDAKAES